MGVYIVFFVYIKTTAVYRQYKITIGRVMKDFYISLTCIKLLRKYETEICFK